MNEDYKIEIDKDALTRMQLEKARREALMLANLTMEALKIENSMDEITIAVDNFKNLSPEDILRVSKAINDVGDICKEINRKHNFYKKDENKQ